MIKKHLSVISLILANTIPLVGVLFWKWQVFPILATYWLETLTIGFWNVFRMRKSANVGAMAKNVDITLNDKPADTSSKNALIGFFLLHFGIFTIVQGSLLFAFFLFLSKETVEIWQIFFAFLVIFASHGVSYFNNFVGKEEYLHSSAAIEMFKPYGRIFVMQFVVIFGANFLIQTGSPLPALILLIVLKTIIDLFSHLKLHSFFLRQKGS